MKTRVTSVMLAALAVVSFVLPALAADSDDVLEELPAISEEIEESHAAVLLDGEAVENLEFEILDGVCYVTVSSFASLMDAEAVVEEEDGYVTVSASRVMEVVVMDGETEEAENAANVVTADLNLTASAGAAYVAANGRYLYTPDGLIQMEGRVAVPVRVMARVYNLAVDYDTENELVLLSHQEGVEPYLADAEAIYDGDVLYWLSRIISAESGNQPLEGKIAVGNVVMNRVYDPKFPDNIHDVIFQKNQFTPASSGSIYHEPNEESVLAAMMVIDGAEVTPTALFFNGVKSAAPKNRVYVTTVGGHAFYE